MIATRLKLARKKAGLSLRGLAEALGGQVSPQAIGKYERLLFFEQEQTVRLPQRELRARIRHYQSLMA